MNSVLDEIAYLRGGVRPIPDLRNYNRYSLIAKEDDGSRTAYCFSVPIYNLQTRKMVSLQFATQNNCSTFVGSSTTVHITDRAFLRNTVGECSVSLPSTVTLRTDNTLYCGRSEIRPTVNGLMVKVFCSPKEVALVDIQSENVFKNVRANDKSFSLMSETHRPFVTLSAIGTADAQGRMIAPCTISYQKTNEQSYTVSVKPESPYGNYVLYEINLQEQKLFQDTTVESRNPGMNNAFGSTAFIGETALFGEQWLYSRPDFSRIAQLYGRPIQQVTLHIPKQIQSQAELSAFRVASRFCSFGSTWNNKISGGSLVAYSESQGNYHHLDMNALFLNSQTQYLTSTDGFILKTKVKGSGFTVIPTGDSFYMPQILSVRYR